MKKRKSLLQRYAEQKKQRKLKAKFIHAKKVFKPQKKEHGTFVFIDTKGKRKSYSSRAIGYLFYVDKGGKKRLLARKGESIPIPRSQTEFDVASFSKKSAVGKWEKKIGLFEIGRVKSISSKKNITDRQLGKRLADATDKFYRQHRGRPLLVVEMAVTGKKGKKVKTVKSSFQLSQAQVTELKRGNTSFIRGLAWKQLSTELSMHDMVTAGSADYIQRLSINKGKPRSKWKTKFGDTWGKGKYKVIDIKRIDFKFKTTSKK